MNELSGILIAATVCFDNEILSPQSLVLIVIVTAIFRRTESSSRCASMSGRAGAITWWSDVLRCGAVKFTQSITKLARFLHRSRLMGSNQIVALPREKFLFTYAAMRWRRVIIGEEVHSTLQINICLMWWTITRLWLWVWAIPDQLDVCVFVSSAQKVWNFCIFWHFERPTCADQMLLSDPRNV